MERMVTKVQNPIANSRCLRLGEAKRQYGAHFVHKISDCIGLRLGRAYGSERENWETDTVMDFAHDCGYINADEHTQLTSLNSEVGKMLRSMHQHPEKFLIPNP